MRMDHDPAPRSIFPRFGFRYWPKTVIRSKCSEWLLRAQSRRDKILLDALTARKWPLAHKSRSVVQRKTSLSSKTHHRRENQQQSNVRSWTSLKLARKALFGVN